MSKSIGSGSGALTFEVRSAVPECVPCPPIVELPLEDLSEFQIVRVAPTIVTINVAMTNASEYLLSRKIAPIHISTLTKAAPIMMRLGFVAMVIVAPWCS